MTWPDGFYVTYDYSSANELLAMADSTGGTIATYDYTNQSQLGSILRANGRETAFSWDPLSRLSRLNHKTMAYTDFAYNPASQIVERMLSNEAYVWDQDYSVGRNYAVNTLNQYTSAGPLSFTYDLNGNLTSDGTNSYGYDPENRMTSATVDGANSSISYDGLGRLHRRGGGGSATTFFLYDGDALIGEYSNSGAVRRRHIHGGGVDDPLVSYIGSSTAASNRRYLHADERGSIVAETGESGGMLALNIYDDWGIPDADNPHDPNDSFNYGRFQYTGQALIEEIGLYYYKARWYSPTLGRFMQTDPIGYEDGMNMYAYVGNDPVNGVDPNGTKVNWITDDPIRRAQDREMMMGYLSNSPTFNADYQILESSEDTYNISVTTQDTHRYSPDSRTITINPTQGLRVSNGIQSPALGGAHEISHAARHASDPSGFEADTNVPSTVTVEPNGTIVVSTPVRPEEIRATNVESQIARELGEPVRAGYRDEQGSVTVPSPIHSCVITPNNPC